MNMAKKFIVFVEDNCPKCEGAKEVMRLEWAQFFEAHPDLPNNKIPYPEKFVWDWFWDNESDFVMDRTSLPRIKANCPHCEGKGVIRNEVSLADALKELRL
jgi:hypothetical protein